MWTHAARVGGKGGSEWVTTKETVEVSSHVSETFIQNKTLKNCLKFVRIFMGHSVYLLLLLLLILLLLLLLTYLLIAIEFSPGGSSPYTGADEANKNKYT